MSSRRPKGGRSSDTQSVDVLEILHYVQNDNAPKTNTRRQNKKTPSRSPKFFSNFAPTLLQQFKMFLQLLSL